MVAVPPSTTTLVITGKFWKLFGPVSTSFVSFGWTVPLLPRLMPWPPLFLIELRLM